MCLFDFDIELADLLSCIFEDRLDLIFETGRYLVTRSLAQFISLFKDLNRKLLERFISALTGRFDSLRPSSLHGSADLLFNLS